MSGKHLAHRAPTPWQQVNEAMVRRGSLLPRTGDAKHRAPAHRAEPAPSFEQMVEEGFAANAVRFGCTLRRNGKHRAS